MGKNGLFKRIPETLASSFALHFFFYLLLTKFEDQGISRIGERLLSSRGQSLSDAAWSAVQKPVFCNSNKELHNIVASATLSRYRDSVLCSCTRVAWRNVENAVTIALVMLWLRTMYGSVTYHSVHSHQRQSPIVELHGEIRCSFERLSASLQLLLQYLRWKIAELGHWRFRAKVTKVPGFERICSVNRETINSKGTSERFKSLAKSLFIIGKKDVVLKEIRRKSLSAWMMSLSAETTLVLLEKEDSSCDKITNTRTTSSWSSWFGQIVESKFGRSKAILFFMSMSSVFTVQQQLSLLWFFLLCRSIRTAILLLLLLFYLHCRKCSTDGSTHGTRCPIALLSHPASL